MKRPWQIGLLFLLCAGMVLVVMSWVTATVLKLEHANVEAQKKADLEETVRLALWRMDAAISPLIIEESARPYFEYNAYNNAGLVYPEVPNDKGWQNELVPSALLTHVPTNVKVHFNWIALDDGQQFKIASPEVPQGKRRKISEGQFGNGDLIRRNDRNLNDFAKNVSFDEIRHAMGIREQEEEHPFVQVAQWTPNQSESQTALQGAQAIDLKNVAEYSARAQQSLNNKIQVRDQRIEQYKTKKIASSWTKGVKASAKEGLQHEAEDIDESVMRPLWIKNVLVLARSVRVGGKRYIQGAWLDWEGIRAKLLSEIKDILPEADLVPAKLGGTTDRTRMLASLPVRLIPGVPAGPGVIIGTPLTVPLIVAWSGALFAVLAVGLLLMGAVSLGERRGAFVSAVTHELRTPLTTFRIYTEMLSEGMITDEKKRQKYLDTLSAEGNRLSHLVENVLSYARLERGRAGGNEEAMPVVDLLDRLTDRMSERAGQAGMSFDVSLSESAGKTVVSVDVSMVEQVLLNLVDNACKYASNAEDRTIHLEVDRKWNNIRLRVRDHGPGVSSGEVKRLFRPFCKSAKHAAESAPGVGLGLALSRRLARQMGGDLRADTGVTEGACFDLTIPVGSE